MFFEQVKWCSSACSHNKTRQTKIPHASAYSFQGISHKLFCPVGLWVCHVCCNGHGLSSRQPILSFKQRHLLRSIIHPLHPLCYFHWVSFHFIHFSSFQSTGYQLFSSPAGSLGLRAFLFFNCDELR